MNESKESSRNRELSMTHTLKSRGRITITRQKRNEGRKDIYHPFSLSPLRNSWKNHKLWILFIMTRFCVWGWSSRVPLKGLSPPFIAHTLLYQASDASSFWTTQLLRPVRCLNQLLNQFMKFTSRIRKLLWLVCKVKLSKNIWHCKVWLLAAERICYREGKM